MAERRGQLIQVGQSLFRLITAPSRWLRRLVYYQERKPYHTFAWLLVIAFVAVGRYLMDITLCQPGSVRPLTALFNDFSFYLASAWVFSLVAHLATGAPYRRCMQVVMVAVFLGLFPPLVDMLANGPGTCVYGYSSGWFSTWTLAIYAPDFKRGVGETTAMWAAIVLTGAYAWIKTASLWRFLVGLLLAYAATFTLATVPGSLASAILSAWGGLAREQGRVIDILLASLAAVETLFAAAAFWVLSPRLSRRLLGRSLHGLPFVVLFLLGAAMVRHLLAGKLDDGPSPAALALAGVGLVLAIVAAIVQNDYFDRAHDGSIANHAAPALDEVRVATLLAFFTATLVLLADRRAGAVLLLINIASAVYNYDFFRAKHFFPANYKIEGVWGGGSFILGALAGVPYAIAPPVPVLIGTALAFGGWSAFNTFKDYKDIRADRRAGVQTLYVLVQKHGGSLRRFHLGLRWVMSLFMLLAPLLLVSLGLPSTPLAIVGIAGGAAMFWTLGCGPRASTVRLALVCVSAYLAAITLILWPGI